MTRQIAAEISKIIKDHLNWPNGNFIPQEPCELLLCGSPAGMQDVTALIEMSERFGLASDELNDYQSLSFGQLVERVRQAQERRNSAVSCTGGEGNGASLKSR
jgi:hypothetical protein